MSISKLYFLFLFCFVATGSQAQIKFKVEYYTAQSGLSHEAVTCMLQDREGFMWFGTWNGINRFDGHTFVTYKSSSGDMSHLQNDRFDQIFEGRSHHLWLKAYDNQIYRFDKRSEVFFPLSSFINKGEKSKIYFDRILAVHDGLVWLRSINEGLFCIPENDLTQEHVTKYGKGRETDFALPSNSINFFHRDREHKIWIGTSEGLSCLVLSAGTYKNIKLPGEVAHGLKFTVFTEDADRLFFGTPDGKLVIYEKKFKRFISRKITNHRLHNLLRSAKRDCIYATTSGGALITYGIKDQKITVATYPHTESLYTMLEDRSGNLWIEPEKQGVINYNPLNGSFRLISQNKGPLYNATINRFRVFEDDNGIIWINLKGGGFGYYHPDKAYVNNFFGTVDVPDHQFSNIITGFYYDDSGILWITPDERGVVKVVLQRNDFKQQLLVEPGNFKSDNEVRGIFYDNQNRLWLGAKSGRLYVRKNEKWITDLFVNEPKDGLGIIYSILQDHKGNIWLGTKGNGLFKASPIDKEETKYRLTHFLPDKDNPNSLHGNEIYALLEDSQGRIWIGTFDQGLNMVSVDGESVRFIFTGNAFRNYPKGSFHKIRHLSLDQSGNIWIGTTDGLLLMDADDRHSPVYKYKVYSKIPGDAQSLGDNDIQYIYRDSKNRMWLATSGGGFCQAIGNQPFQSLRFRNFTTKDGLPNDYVLSCAEDKRGNIWIATENGLSKFSPWNQVFRNYDAYDGMPKAGFSEAACKQLPNGRLVFGTDKGYLSFDPDHISIHRKPATVVFSNLQINNEDAGAGMNDPKLAYNINYVRELRLKYNQNIISIDYAILDYSSSDKQDFAYRLLGFDSGWHSDRQQRRVTYTNLPPGHYVFEVKSLSTDLYSNTPYKSLEITILPPPWKTWWAYLVYLVLIVLLAGFIRKTALTMLRLRQKIAVEQRLAELKMSFFTNVSHELRTPLTLIVNPIEQLSRKEKLSEEGAALMDVVRKNAARMVRFINQLLDLRKIQSDKVRLNISEVEIVTFVRKTSDYFVEAARNKRIKLDIVSDQKNLFVWVDVEKLDVVLYNLLGNAFKFTPEGKTIKVLIRQQPGDQSIFIEVWDQGPGVEKEKLKDIFELFYEGAQRAGQHLKGTGIGLALSRELIQLHGGAIWAYNNEAGGLSVCVQLKPGKDHYQTEDVHFVDLPQVPVAEQKPIEQMLVPQPVYPVAPKSSETPQVLLVEDNSELRAFLQSQLSEFYRVEVARDGAEGWQKAVNLIPDLIVSDIMMPVMDGIQLLDQVKNNVNTSHIPVVLLSAKYSIESQIEGLNYGADYYITKPFKNEFLLAAIDNLLRQRKKLFESLIGKQKKVELSPEPIVITSKDQAFLKEVIRVVEEKMADPDFNIETVAENMNMSRTTFYKKFKSLTNLTPVEFVRDMRLQRAKQYLDAGGSNISEAAYLAGFNNPKYFSTCFKEKYYVSPSDYLKSKSL